MSKQPPPCRVLLRSKQGVEVFTVPSSSSESSNNNNNNNKERAFLVEGGTSIQTFAPDGSCVFLLLSGHGVIRCPLKEDNAMPAITSSNTPAFLKNSSKIQMMDVSPKGTFLLTWERASNEEPNNMKVWLASTGDLLYGFPQKNLQRVGWPNLRWTHDEQYAFLMITNEIRVYRKDDFLSLQQQQTEEGGQLRYISKCRCPGITSMSLPSSSGSSINNTTPSSYLFTTFCPKTSKDKPARASLHIYSPPPPSSSQPPPGNNNNKPYPSLLSKSLFQADEATVQWSPRGNAALIKLQTSVDTSGESYYGSATLYLFSKDARDVIPVPLPQEGPVSDVQWMPNSTQSNPSAFVVIAGKMPPMASLHNGSTGEATFLFGNAHRNTISWSNHGRFLCLAGFGNLAGNMSFWDKNKCKLIPPTGTNTASCTIGYGWSPDSRNFAVSRTYPRRTVDNGFQLFRYNGEEVTNVPWKNEDYCPDKLLEAAFIPSLLEVYPDRPQSPNLRQQEAAAESNNNNNNTANATTASSLSSLSSKKAGGGGRYVPPSARGRAGGTSLADRIRREKEGDMKGAGKVTSARPGLVVGMANAAPPAGGKSKSALKREKEKARKKQKEEEEAKRAEEEAKKKQEEAAAAAADPEKRARKLKKTLKQIEGLKGKDPSSLNDDQKAKIESETSLREELAKLGL